MDRSLPQYDDIPSVEGMPKGCAWSLFNTDGKKDVFGCLNKINSRIIREAAVEVKDGFSISLK
jgi:hypothetical protein